MATVSLTVPDGDVVNTLQSRAASLGFNNAKQMTIAFLKQQYKIQKRLEAEESAKTTVRASVAEANIT